MMVMIKGVEGSKHPTRFIPVFLLLFSSFFLFVFFFVIIYLFMCVFLYTLNSLVF
jgi:hypothetical protein